MVPPALRVVWEKAVEAERRAMAAVEHVLAFGQSLGRLAGDVARLASTVDELKREVIALRKEGWRTRASGEHRTVAEDEPTAPKVGSVR